MDSSPLALCFAKNLANNFDYAAFSRELFMWVITSTTATCSGTIYACKGLPSSDNHFFDTSLKRCIFVEG